VIGTPKKANPLLGKRKVKKKKKFSTLNGKKGKKESKIESRGGKRLPLEKGVTVRFFLMTLFPLRGGGKKRGEGKAASLCGGQSSLPGGKAGPQREKRSP